MTQAFIIAAFALVLMAGWALLRASKRRTTGTAPSGETNLLLNHSPVGALLLDTELRVTWANDAFCGLLGLLHKELIGRELSEATQQESSTRSCSPWRAEAAAPSRKNRL